MPTTVSQVLDTLKQAELVHAGCLDSKTAGLGAIEQVDRRRTPRIQVQIPMFVYGYASRSVPFYEEARTMTINAHGGLLCMQTAVQPGQRLLVINVGNERTQECVVVFVEARLARGIAVAFEFPTSMSQFWHNLEIGNRRSFRPSTPLDKARVCGLTLPLGRERFLKWLIALAGTPQRLFGTLRLKKSAGTTKVG